MKPTQRQNGQPQWRIILQGCALLAMVCLAYLPALRGGFIWDDDANVTNNQTLHSLDGLRRIWFEPGATQQYYPLTHTGFWIDYHLWRLNPLPYHLENILLHALSVVLLWRILKRLAVPGAWLGAALFAVHPVCVESVAWITERKNTLSGIFFLGAILMSIRFWLPSPTLSSPKSKSRPSPAVTSGSGPWKFYWLALVLYLFALWAKTAVVGLPAVILLLLWWKRGKVGWRDLLSLVPFIVIGVAMGLMTMWVETNHLGATGQEWRLSLVERGLIAGRAFWFYLGKLIWPHPLMFLYPRWVIQTSQPLAYLPVVAVIGAGLFLWQKRNGWGRPALFVMGYFIALLFPVMGFFKVFFYRYSFVCDHFQYLACIGPLALAAAGLTAAFGHFQKRETLLQPVGCGILVLVFGVMTWQQAGVYHDLETLWREALARNPDAWMAHTNLGNVLVKKGKLDEAIQQFNEALRLKPDYAEGYYDLGNTLVVTGDLEAAIRQYNLALKFEPDYAEAHDNLGNVLARKGNVVEAIHHYNEALRIEPNFADAAYNLGNILAAQGNADEAIRQYTKVLQIEPDNAPAHNNLGNVLADAGHVDEAILHYNQALNLQPKFADAHYNLGLALAGKGKLDEAILHYQAALRIRPDYEDAKQQLKALSALKNRPEPAK